MGNKRIKIDFRGLSMVPISKRLREYIRLHRAYLNISDVDFAKICNFNSIRVSKDIENPYSINKISPYWFKDMIKYFEKYFLQEILDIMVVEFNRCCAAFEKGDSVEPEETKVGIIEESVVGGKDLPGDTPVMETKMKDLTISQLDLVSGTFSNINSRVDYIEEKLIKLEGECEKLRSEIGRVEHNSVSYHSFHDVESKIKKLKTFNKIIMVGVASSAFYTVHDQVAMATGKVFILIGEALLRSGVLF